MANSDTKARLATAIRRPRVVPNANARRARKPSRPAGRTSSGASRCRRKFLEFYPGGFNDQDYLALERDYKAAAHAQWDKLLDRPTFRAMIEDGRFADIAAQAVRIESRTNLIFSFEKMALRDAVRPPAGARAFALGLYDMLFGRGTLEHRFERWCGIVAGLPRKQTRVLTWPIVTVFPFIAQPDTHIFFKPNVTRRAAREYGFELHYRSRPNWATYAELLRFAEIVRREQRVLRPRDMIDIQSFIWVQGSDEYD